MQANLSEAILDSCYSRKANLDGWAFKHAELQSFALAGSLVLKGEQDDGGGNGIS